MNRNRKVNFTYYSLQFYPISAQCIWLIAI